MTDEQKFILNEEETMQLLTAFFHEALKFINVPKDKYPEINIGVGFSINGMEPIHIEYEKRKILFFIPFFKMMISLNRNAKNDSPTIYRTFGYKLAYIWNNYLTTGTKTNFITDIESSIFAESLKIVKGIPIHKNPLLPSNIKQIIGFDPNDKKPILEMLKNKFGMDCIVNKGYDIASRQVNEFISFSPDEYKKRGEELGNLYIESINRQIPSLKENEPGSITNPFPNVDAAADFILKTEQEYLLSDRYRHKINNEQFYYDFERNYFRISWASPHVGYYHLNNAESPCFVVNQLTQTDKTMIPRFSIKPSLRRNKFLYRGQAEFFSPCKPSLFRDSRKSYYVDDMIQINEMEVLLREHPLVKLFEQGFMLMNEFVRFKVNYVGLSQHYYNRTHLLDLTNDIEVAKFFAITTFDMNNDRYIEYDGDKLGVLYYFDIQADTFSKREGRKYNIDTIGKQPFMRSGNQSGFLINLEREDDFNLLPEVRYVFFRHDKNITSRIFKESMNGDKYMPQEILRTHWYTRMADEKERKKISYEALKINFANNPHESHSHILKELQKKGFEISNKYKSTFTDDELDLYYKNSEQIWAEFCSNIFFYGPEGLLLKKHLVNLPNDKRYRWAFYRN